MLYTNYIPFYIWDLSILGFCIHRRVREGPRTRPLEILMNHCTEFSSLQMKAKNKNNTKHQKA